MLFFINTTGSITCQLEEKDEGLEHFIIPKEIEGIPVKRLLPNFFRENNSVKTITIPSSVVEIDYNAFNGCKNLESVIFLDDSELVKICCGAFANCEKLKDFDFKKLKNLDTIEGHSFENTKSLKEIDLSETKVSYIYKEAFSNSGLETIKFSKETYSIGHMAFFNTKIKELDFSSIEKEDCILKENCFEGSCVETINFNNNNTIFTIFECAFKNCNCLKEVEINKRVILYGESIFKNCRNLKSVTFSGCADYEKQTEILKYTFENCSSLENVTLGQDIAHIYSCAFQNCTSLKRFVCPPHLEKIGNFAFAGCKSLEYFDLSSCNTVHIYDNVFGFTPLSDKNLIVDFCSCFYFNEKSFNEMDNFDIKCFKEEHPFCVY